MSKENLGNLMVDIEGLGRGVNSVITSIAAVEFDINTGKTGKVFYKKISINSCLKLGLKVDGDSIRFWLEQPIESRKELITDDELTLGDALHQFSLFLNEVGAIRMWANPARFDLGTLENAYNAIGKKIPWLYSLERDCLTLWTLVRKPERETIPFEGVKHHPVDDCYHQIKRSVNVFKSLNLVEK